MHRARLVETGEEVAVKVLRSGIERAFRKDVDAFYRSHCIPRKIEVNLTYARRASLLGDTWIILQTVLPFLRR